MIGRANIEGSKSNVAMNACTATETSYACGVWEGVSHGPGGWFKDAPYSDQAGGVIEMSLYRL